MKSFQIVVILTLIASHVSGQNYVYFTPSFQKRSDIVTEYKRAYQNLEPRNYLIKDYKRGLLTMEGRFRGFSDMRAVDQFIWYYRNGKYGGELLDTKNKIGELTIYDDGEKKETRIYRNNEIYYGQVWKEGEPVLENGNGELITYDSYMRETSYKT